MLNDLFSAENIVVFGFIVCLCFIAGWFFDKILGYSGLGVIGNWLSLALGAFIGLYGYSRQGYFFKDDPIFAIVTISAAAFAILCVVVLAKRIVRA